MAASAAAVTAVFAAEEEATPFCLAMRWALNLRRMREEPPELPLFGATFLWAALFRRSAADTPAPADLTPAWPLTWTLSRSR